MAAPIELTARSRVVLVWVARTLVLIAVCAGLLMQLQAGMWLPPKNSLSQYANTPGRWSFVVALFALGLAAAVVAALVPRIARIDRAAAWMLGIAGAGFVLAAAIPAPALEEHNPFSDALHQAGAICGTFALTIGGLLLAWRYRHSVAGWCALVVSCAAAIALVLLTMSNFDVDVTGLGRRESWALHQSISLVCMVLVVALLPTAFDDRRARG